MTETFYNTMNETNFAGKYQAADPFYNQQGSVGLFCRKIVIFRAIVCFLMI